MQTSHTATPASGKLLIRLTHRLVAACVIAIASTGSASAANLTWTLNNVSFNDGGTATGSFTFDAQTQQVSDWLVSVSPWTYNGIDPFGDVTPDNAVTSPAYRYDSAMTQTVAFFTSDASYGYITLRDNSQFYGDNPNNTREIRLAFTGALDTPGATVALNLDSGFGAECWNCAPARTFSSGSVTAVPEPTQWAMLLAGGLLLGATVARRAPPRPRAQPANWA
jgi:hypothetical protein